MVLWLLLGLVPYVGRMSFLVTAGGGGVTGDGGGVTAGRGGVTAGSGVQSSWGEMWETAGLCTLGELHSLYLMKKWMSGVQFASLVKQFVKLRREERVSKKEGGGHKDSNLKHTIVTFDEPDPSPRKPPGANCQVSSNGYGWVDTQASIQRKRC